MEETINIPKKEYDRLKKLEQVDHDLVQSIAKSFKEVSEGKIRKAF